LEYEDRNPRDPNRLTEMEMATCLAVHDGTVTLGVRAGTTQGPLLAIVIGTLVTQVEARAAARHGGYYRASRDTSTPQGEILMLHSIVVAHAFRKRGLAKALLEELLTSLPRHNPTVRRVVALIPENLLGVAESMGFRVVEAAPVESVDGLGNYLHVAATVRGES
jgi:GNAT superfamily N-acetyltransferase